MADDVKSCVWIVKSCEDGKIRIQHITAGTEDSLTWRGPRLEVGTQIDLGGDRTLTLGDALRAYEESLMTLAPVAGKPGLFFDKANARIINMGGYSGEECKAALASCLPGCPPVAIGDRVRRINGVGVGVVSDLNTLNEVRVGWDNGDRSWIHRSLIEPAPIEQAPEPAHAPYEISRLGGNNVENWGKDLAGIVPCLRCGGPAGYLGISCQRVGGCRTAEERVAAREPKIIEALCGLGLEPRCTTDSIHWFPSRDLALADWRERALAEERVAPMPAPASSNGPELTVRDLDAYMPYLS